MNKKSIFKFTLDFCMVIVLVLFYNKRSINMTFHELGGLILIGVMLIHVLINGKWVVAVTKKIFHKSVRAKTKLSYLINALLLISFLLIGISGIFISKTLFHIVSNGSFAWKTIHYTASAVALILIGIHLGLHKQFLCSMCVKLLHLPQKIGRIIGTVLSVIIVIFGCYSLFATSFTQWLSMPFTTTQMRISYSRDFPDGEIVEGDFPQGDIPEGEFYQGDMPDRELPDGGIKERILPDGDLPQSGGKDGGFSEGETGDINDSNDTKSTDSETGKFPTRGDFTGGKMHEGKGQATGIGTILITVAQFFSIAYVFAAITVLIEILIVKNKKKKHPAMDEIILQNNIDISQSELNVENESIPSDEL